MKKIHKNKIQVAVTNAIDEALVKFDISAPSPKTKKTLKNVAKKVTKMIKSEVKRKLKKEKKQVAKAKQKAEKSTESAKKITVAA